MVWFVPRSIITIFGINYSVCTCAQLCLMLCDPMECSLPALLSMGFSRQEYWSGLPFPSPRIFLTQGSNLHLLHWQVDTSPLSHLGSPKLVHRWILTWGMLMIKYFMKKLKTKNKYNSNNFISKIYFEKKWLERTILNYC